MKIFPATTTFTGTSFSDGSGLNRGRIYTYFVRARNDRGSTDSNTVAVAIPSNVCSIAKSPGAFALAAASSCSRADSVNPAVPVTQLTWSPSAGAAEYDLHRDGVLLQTHIHADTRWFIDEAGLHPGSTYRYVVTARNSAGTTDSNVAVVTAANCSPPGAFGLSASTSCGNHQPVVDLFWNASPAATRYDVYRNGVVIASSLLAAMNHYADPEQGGSPPSGMPHSGPKSGHSYSYIIKASNFYGARMSNRVSITAATNCGPPGQPTGAADLAITANFEPKFARRNSEVTLTVAVKNLGPAVARDVVVTVPTPAGTSFLEAPARSGYSVPPSASPSVGTIRIPVHEIRAGATVNISATLFVYAKLGATLTAAPSVSASSVDQDLRNNSTIATSSVAIESWQYLAEQRISRTERLLAAPLPALPCDWLGDIVQNLFHRTQYEEMYLSGVNQYNVAVNLLLIAKRFYRRNDYENAIKYADLAVETDHRASQIFGLAVDAYYGRVSKVSKAAYTVSKIGSGALGVLAASGCGWPCQVLKFTMDSAVDYSMKGATEAVKGRVADLLLKLILRGSGLSDTELLEATNKWIGNAGIYERLASLRREPEIAKQLMVVLAGVADISEQEAGELLKWVADLSSAPVYMSPPLQRSGGGSWGWPSSEETFEYTAPVSQTSAGTEKEEVLCKPLSESAATSDGSNWPSVCSVVNAASYAGGGVSPGEIVTIFGQNLGPDHVVGLALDEDGKVATTLEGVRVLFNGVAAPLLYVSRNQIGAVVPFGVADRDSVQVQVEVDNVRSFPSEISVVPARPGVFSLDMSGGGPGAVLNEDGSINSPANPASKGSIVTIYSTGGGQTAPASADGQVIGPPPRRLMLPVEAFVGGLPAEVTYAGGAPGLVSGTVQINVRVPANVLSSDAVPVLLNIDGVNTQPGITMAVR